MLERRKKKGSSNGFCVRSREINVSCIPSLWGDIWWDVNECRWRNMDIFGVTNILISWQSYGAFHLKQMIKWLAWVRRFGYESLLCVLLYANREKHTATLLSFRFIFDDVFLKSGTSWFSVCSMNDSCFNETVLTSICHFGGKTVMFVYLYCHL